MERQSKESRRSSMTEKFSKIKLSKIKLSKINLKSYSEIALPHLEAVLHKNLKVMNRLTRQLVKDVKAGKALFVFGSGHSAILPLELYHRAGGPSFLIPLVADYLLPTAGPPVVRLLERIPGSAQFLLDRAQPRSGEMLWLVSQSGINAAVVDLAIEAKRRNLRTVAFTSLTHSQAVDARHPSGKKLFEVCDQVVDWGGVTGDAALKISKGVAVGPLSTLSGIFLAHSILSVVVAELQQLGIFCSYTSVNTSQGEKLNRRLEEVAKVRDPLLR
jgi:uncharacterized phosphosugar-binding protein